MILTRTKTTLSLHTISYIKIIGTQNATYKISWENIRGL